MENQDYLSHHGILGMKWGRRNGPPYPLGPGDHSASEKKAGWEDSLSKKGAREYEKALNKLDKERAKNMGDAHRNDRLKNQWDYKAHRRKGKIPKGLYKSDEKLANIKAKSSEAAAKADAYRRSAADAQKRIDGVLANAKKEGYTINSVAISRDVTNGKERALNALALTGSILAASVVGVGVAPTIYRTEPGVDYQVKRK